MSSKPIYKGENMPKSWSPETAAIHAAYDKKSGEGTMAVPIYQTTAYEFGSAETAANRFALQELGNIYTRLNNPTTGVLEGRFAEVEGGAAALATSSGAAATFYAIANLAAAGENILLANKIYGGTLSLAQYTIKRFGIEARIFDPQKPETIEPLIDAKTRAIIFESISNPSIDIADAEGIAAIAKRHKIVTIVDNTVATPYLFRPFDWGVDVSVHSLSKYTSGQGLGIGGIIVERHGLNDLLIGNDRYAHFNEPDPSYHGLVYAKLPFPLFTLRARLSLARDIGAISQPFTSWLFIQGLETLNLRIQRHSESALEIAKWLGKHPKVKSVKYPTIAGGINAELAKKYLKNGASGLLSFDVGDAALAKKTLNNTKIFSRVVNIGDSKSIITHPSSTTHQQLNEQEQLDCGILPGLVRLSIGLENPADLIADLEQALNS
ncbi:MAG: aminotransferase class I/II-fold pyridoxal phosphate-dependent enzyme [Helicobacteraceae bacterium]|jgi:O-acetylhomoserine (thiol)-lyase|nr:aminotransferase class I/II-fold pyridoxal phosphate-dependent enzyme [Helicobacteraceae bacterium]